MENKTYQLRYLPVFEQDLLATVSHISITLKNPAAAMQLIDDVEVAIQERLVNPVSFEQYKSTRERVYPYYRIYVRNYVIYYVVIDDIMEVRRFLYGVREFDRHL